VAEELVPIFRVENAESLLGWYRRLGFEVIGKHQFEAGFPLYVFLQRGDVRLHLSEHTGDAPTGSVAYFYVETIDDLATEFGVAIETQPWGREIELVDPDGNRIRVGAVGS
jgi:catechol 2,3-dioxygenase-like lactoylglutathione lyase family enzyme